MEQRTEMPKALERADHYSMNAISSEARQVPSWQHESARGKKSVKCVCLDEKRRNSLMTFCIPSKLIVAASR